MSLNDAGRSSDKSLVEHGLCFGTAVVALALVAVGLQWVVAALL